MWCYRRIMNINLMDRITNEEVLERIRERRALWKSLRRRRDQMIGHTLRHGGLLRDILEGDGEEKGKDQIRIFRPNNHSEKSKRWHRTEQSGDRWLCQTSLRTVYSMMIIIFILLIFGGLNKVTFKTRKLY